MLADEALHRVTEKHGPTAANTPLLDVDPNAPITVREHGVLAPLGIDNDIEPVRELARIEPVDIAGIDGQRVDAQDIGIDARMPNQARVG